MIRKSLNRKIRCKKRRQRSENSTGDTQYVSFVLCFSFFFQYFEVLLIYWKVCGVPNFRTFGLQSSEHVTIQDGRFNQTWYWYPSPTIRPPLLDFSTVEKSISLLSMRRKVTMRIFPTIKYVIKPSCCHQGTFFLPTIGKRFPKAKKQWKREREREKIRSKIDSTWN